jgi:hypothetical protein
LIAHVVLLKIKADVPQDVLERLNQALAALQTDIPGLVDYRWGVNVSPENLDHGFEHGFIMTFEDVAARDTYLPHPQHREVAALIGSLCEDVLVFDMEM